MGKVPLAKYVNASNPTVTVCIGKIQISNVLVNLGASINVMRIETLKKLGLTNLSPTPAILETTNRSTIKPKGIMDDLVVFGDSWEYPVDFVVLQPKLQLGGHPLILEIPWLATTNSYIIYRSGSMIIYDESSIKNLTLYPLSRLSLNSKIPL